VEHLAFNATEEFENHAIIKFLESIGAEFGACSNAYTTCEQRIAGLCTLSHLVFVVGSDTSAAWQHLKDVRMKEDDGVPVRARSPLVVRLRAEKEAYELQDEGELLLS
jgi:hypothetical protein